MLTVLWHDADSEGYTDLFPEDWFRSEGSWLARIHDVRGPRNGIHKAMCNVSVRGAVVDLSYTPFPDFNTRNHMWLGVMRIRFDNAKRKHAMKILWRDKGESAFRPSDTTIAYERSTSPDQLKDVDLLESADEGSGKLVKHLRRERNSKLVAIKKAAVFKDKGKLSCEACGFTYKDKYGDLGKEFCEVHHRSALAKGDRRKTRLKDLAILCSSCHRMIHKTVPMLSVGAFRRKHVRSA